MHLIIGLLIIGVAIFVLYKLSASNGAAVEPPAGGKSDRPFAFLANGLIFQRRAGGAVEQLHSLYAQEAADKRERARDRHSWKEGTSFNIAAGGGMRSFKAADKPVQATSVARAANGDLLYFMSDDHVGGLFRRVAETGNELRVMLRQHLHLSDLNPAPLGDRVAASVRQSDGVSNIVMFKDDGNQFREVTGGDTVDTSPAWVLDAPKKLLFQSAGLARDPQGYIVAQGHASIQMLDMDSGSVSTVLEDARFDYLRPRVCPAGNLHFIRRPYEAPRYGAGSMILDTLLFPFRLLRALFHYLNFFSLMYTRKPLTSASGPAVQADMKNILLQGKRIDAEQALRNERPVQGVPSLVPTSWELVRRDRDGAERVLASSVATYDIAADSTVVYSNGRGVFVLEKNGSARHAYTGDLIGDLVAAG
ncbi:MAG: hypothetical protein JNM76_18190 [Betaproteobacteria bacterium]|nr:hypothetical protein [Betaproteobacteria bacterium]